MYKIKYFIVIGVIVSWVLAACQNPVEHTAPAIHNRDSVAMMTSYGVNTLISDSGVIKYRIVTERWEVNTNCVPSRWIFDKGMLLEQFDEKFHINSYIQCDTAYYFDQERVWKLYGRVRILTKDGLRFTSEQLTWDENKHELSSHVFSKLVTPERTLLRVASRRTTSVVEAVHLLLHHPILPVRLCASLQHRSEPPPYLSCIDRVGGNMFFNDIMYHGRS